MSELHLNKKKNTKRKPSEFGRLGRNGRVVLTLILGTIVLCAFLVFMQNHAAERRQRSSGEKILSEVAETIQVNDSTMAAIREVFHRMHQTSVNTLSDYISHRDILAPLQQSARTGNHEETAAMQQKLSLDLAQVRDQVGAENIYLIDENGLIILCSSPGEIGSSLAKQVTAQELDALTFCGTAADGVTQIDGTEYTGSNGTITYAPVEAEEEFLYSHRLTNRDGVDYYIVASESSRMLKMELDGIKDIATVLDGIAIGKSGFIFAMDLDTDKFLFFDDGSENLTGQDFTDLSPELMRDGYAGYQTLNGTRYYCVSKTLLSTTYGNYTITAAISRDELIDKNFSTITIACLAFGVVAATVIAYGLVLREEMANYMIKTEDKLEETLSEQVQGGKVKFTDEEIQERVRLKLIDTIDRQTDKRFLRLNIGTRSAKGVQHYLSTYILGRMMPVVGIGLVLIFITSFFSQTLLALGDVTATTRARLNDVQRDLQLNNETASTISMYIDRQYLYKVNLIANLVEEMQDEILVFDTDGEDIYPVFDTVDGKKVPCTDLYGNRQYASARNAALRYLCEDNAVVAIYVLDENGQTLATNTDYWYFRLSQDPEGLSYPFRRILEGEVDAYVQGVTADEATGQLRQYIGVAHYYYTIQNADGSTAFVDHYAYRQQQEGTWKGPAITRHRGLVQVCVDDSQLKQLTQTTSLEYLLSGMYAYDGNSFFVALDNSDEHIVLYSPFETSIGKSAASIGVTPSAFQLNGVYNGFQEVNGVTYYQSFTLVDDCFIATAVPIQSIYTARNQISLITTVVSTVFIFLSCVMFSFSSDLADEKYTAQLRKNAGGRKSRVNAATPLGRILQGSPTVRYIQNGWQQKTPEQKLKLMVMTQLTIFSAAIAVIVFYALTHSSGDSIFTYIFSRAWERGLNIFSMTESMMIMLLIYTGTKLSQMFVRSFCSSLGARVATTGDLVISVLRYGGILGGFFYCLYLFGLDTGSLLTSAGILSVVLGLGAQSLISDIVAGVFIVFEGEFRVGDIVSIGGFRGTVLEIGLRTTKVIDLEKNVKIFNNSSISDVVNMTREASVAVVDVSIEYGESLERVEAILKKGFPVIRRNLPAITDGPFYKGVASLGDSAVIIRIIAMCSEEDRVQLIRDMNREIFLLFGQNDVNIPFPQVTLSYLKESDKTATPAEMRASAGFVQEQKELLQALYNDDED